MYKTSIKSVVIGVIQWKKKQTHTFSFWLSNLYREMIVIVKKINVEFSMEICILSSTKPKNWIKKMVTFFNDFVFMWTQEGSYSYWTNFVQIFTKLILLAWIEVQNYVLKNWKRPLWPKFFLFFKIHCAYIWKTGQWAPSGGIILKSAFVVHTNTAHCNEQFVKRTLEIGWGVEARQRWNGRGCF